MKDKDIARQGFCDVYQEDDRNGFSRPHVPIDWRKQSASASVLHGKSLGSQTKKPPKSRILIPRWFVQPSANCRNLGVASAIAESSFQLLTSGALIAI
jgi:hypothetical protein